MPVKIVWYNQTSALRFFTPENDDDRMNRYIETMIRRTFGTDDAMKKSQTSRVIILRRRTIQVCDITYSLIIAL